MFVVRSAFRVGSSLLRTQKHSVVPLASTFGLHTSSTMTEKKKSKNRWYHWYWDAPTEYDEHGNELGFPDEIHLAMGPYKKELEWRAAGYVDPYGLLPIKRGDKGTKIDPIMVPSCDASHLICCECFEGDINPQYQWIHQGELTRCGCGYWYLLYYEEPFIVLTCPTV